MGLFFSQKGGKMITDTTRLLAKRSTVLFDVSLNFGTDVNFCEAGNHIVGCSSRGNECQSNCPLGGTQQCPIVLWNANVLVASGTICHTSARLTKEEKQQAFIPKSVLYDIPNFAERRLYSFVITRNSIETCSECESKKREGKIIVRICERGDYLDDLPKGVSLFQVESEIIKVADCPVCKNAKAELESSSVMAATT